MSEYEMLTAPPSEFLRFCDHLRGYDVYFGEKKLWKWELFHLSQNPEMRESISRRTNKSFTYKQKAGWLDGVLDISEILKEEKKSGLL